MEHGWSIKHLHRMIVLSSTYQMSSQADAQTLARDPENRLLTRVSAATAGSRGDLGQPALWPAR